MRDVTALIGQAHQTLAPVPWVDELLDQRKTRFAISVDLANVLKVPRHQ